MDQAGLNHLRHEDRKQLEMLLEELNGARNSLRRDACGDWTITGSRGTIRSSGGKFYVYLPSGSVLAWTWAKKKLAGFTIALEDGDEGILVMTRLPDTVEAGTLRSYIGLRQTRDVSPDLAQSFQNVRQNGSAGPYVRYSD